jgi:hypothetical protein
MLFAVMKLPKNVDQNWGPPKIGGPVLPHTLNMPKADAVQTLAIISWQQKH